MSVQDCSEMFIRKAEVRKLTGLSDTTIWRLEKLNKFPHRRYLSANARGWFRSEILAWMDSRPAMNEEKRNEIC